MILSRRALNRALLERQLLLARSDMSAKDAIGFLGHEDRSRIVGDDFRRTPWIEGTFGTVLVDGFIGALWKIARKGGTATLLIEPASAVEPKDIDAVAEEGERLLTFTDPDASHVLNVAQVTKSTGGPRGTRGAAGSRARPVTH